MRFLFAIIAVLGLVALAIGHVPEAQAAAHFRILDVRAEYGHLVVEVEHFNDDGTFAYFENYLWPGREGDKHARVLNKDGKLLLNDGTVAPEKESISARGPVQYRPAGKAWKRETTPWMDTASITSVIESKHQRRKVTGWTEGQSRLTVHPRNFTAADTNGVGALVTKFAGLVDTAYVANAQGLVTAYAGILPPPDAGLGLFEWGTVSTFYPDSDPESTSTDGYVQENTDGAWSTIRADVGTIGDSYGSRMWDVGYAATASSPNYSSMSRAILLFDTRSIDDGESIDSATLDIVVFTGGVIDGFSDSLAMVTSTPASNTTLVSADYSQLGTTDQATDKTYASFTADSSTYNSLTLNATGLGNISKTGVSKFGLRAARDADDNEPVFSSSAEQFINIAPADEVLSGDKRPRLVVTHSTPPAIAVTGTIGDGATETEVRDGGGTIILTVSGDTWLDAGTPFDLSRSGIINGLDSDQSGSNGWDARVKANMTLGSVVRTSSTVVTITVAASDVSDYEIRLSETVTATVPGSALSGGVEITAAPTFRLDPVSESLAVTGTLGASGGTAAELRSGGETVILTLTNAKWNDAGATFNNQRQTILDHCVANLDDQAGWNARRAAGDFLVGDVVRTSATVVTITLTAATTYAVPTTETITCTAPNEAMLLIKDLTGSPTFNIVPGFALTGNRVSAAIDLSSVTDVALCGFGWTVTTPTNTTATFETSVNGGTSYSTATNGNCPTGISAGASLASITDFRVRVTLTTTDSTVTPLVTGMALVIQDTTGQALYYQLNTTPGVTITDRSANSNAGTMSFPISTSGVGVSTGALKSTRATISLDQTLTTADVVTPATGVVTAANLFTPSVAGSDTQTLPFDGIVTAMATGAGLPVQSVWIIGIGVLAIFTGAGLYIVTSGSFLFAGIGMGTVVGVGAGLGAVGLNPGWTVLLSAVLMLAFVLLRQRGPIPL